MIQHSSFILLATLLLACQPAAQADEPQPRREISVSGEASRLVAPDRADLSLAVEGRAPEPEAAMQAAGDAAARVIASLDGLLPAEKIQATATQLRRVVKGTDRHWVRDRGEPMEMLATRQIRLNDLPVERLAQAMRALSAQPLARIDAVELKVSNAREIEDELLLLALDDARQRATAMAERLDVALGLPIRVQAQSGSPPQPRMQAEAMMLRSGDAGGGFEQVGENILRARVEVSFELEPPR